MKCQVCFSLVCMMLTAMPLLTGCNSSDIQKEITVERINIVDEFGIERLVISSRLPDPVVRGERLERSIAPAGLIWHDENGNEIRGLALARAPQWKTTYSIPGYQNSEGSQSLPHASGSLRTTIIDQANGASVAVSPIQIRITDWKLSFCS